MDGSNLEASKQANLIALCTVMLTLVTLAVLLRCWSVSVSPTHKFGFDDFFAILALPFIVVETSLIYWWISLGLGRHASIVPPEDLLQGPRIIFAAAFFYDAGIVLPKFSALFFYYRIFEKTSRWFYVALLVVGTLNAGWFVAGCLSTLFQCVPIKKAWSTVEGGHCFSQWAWFLGTAIPSTMIDLCILIMPLPMLWRLQMSKTRKFMIIGVFLCGYSVIVVSIGRLVSLAKAGATLEADLTWSTITYLELVQCEGPLSVISVCLPNIFNLGKLIRTRGLQSVLRGGKSQIKRPYLSNGIDSNNAFIGMETHPQDRRELYWENPEEPEPKGPGESILRAPVRLSEQDSNDR